MTFEKPLSTELKTAIDKAVQLLKQGDVIGLPTETVYGLAAVISNEDAIRKIFSTKNRPFFDPLIVHVSSIEQAKTLVHEWPESANILAEAFWPGPLTMVLPKNHLVSDLITSGLETVGLRYPKHSIAREIIKNLGEPVAAPSANKFGKTSPSKADHVRTEFDNSVFTVDGGPCEVGIESSIIKIIETQDTIEITVLRAGSIVTDEIKSALASKTNKRIVFHQPGTNIEAPGQVKHHYMPTIPVLFITESKWKNLNTNFKDINNQLSTNYKNPICLNLDSSPELAARELYSKLRECSLSDHDLIVFVHTHLQVGEYWTAILDRLRRASTHSI